MQRFADDRREIYVHSDVTVDDLPVRGEFDVPPVSNSDAFLPDNMSDPKIYPGDVMVGVAGGEIAFVELIVDKQEDLVVVTPLNTGIPTFVKDNIFSSRIFRADQIHIFEGIGKPIDEPDVAFDVSKLQTPQDERPR
ncbi:MAG: hypothetical protein A07HR67_00971 [uncultured archaeon A07HR67]|jgi:hypothetical protein|nr:MAG: hypothetical protein A07HR67_00971 [uncultured archaeon A07HR67]